MKRIVLLLVFWGFFHSITNAQDSLATYTLEQLDQGFHQAKDAENYEQLLPYAQAAVQKAAEKHGEQDSCYARMLYQLAYAYDYGEEDFEKAIEYYEKAIALQEVYPSSRALANSLLALADIYNYNYGDIEQAEGLYLKEKDIRSKTVGKNHPEYANSLNSLANLNAYKGDMQQAVKYCKQATVIYKKTLGDEHPEYATSISNLAAFYKEVGNFEASEKLLLEAIELDRKTLGEEHLNYTISLNNLGNLYKAMERYKEAEALYLKVLSIEKNISSKYHTSSASTLNNLADLYWVMGNYEEAEALFSKALAIKKEELGEFHSRYALSLNNLAVLYEEMGKYEEAEPLYVQTITIYRETLGEDHPTYATTINNLALLYKAQERYEEAEALFLESLEIDEKLYGTIHKSYAITLNNLALLYQDMLQYKKAEHFFLKVQKIRHQLFESPHTAHAHSLNSIGNLYLRMERYAESEQMFFEALKIYKQTLGELHPDYAIPLNNLALLYQKLGNLDKAFAYAMASIACNSTNFKTIFPNIFAQQETPTHIFPPQQCCQEPQPSEFLKLSELEFLHAMQANNSLNTLLKVTKKQYTTNYGNPQIQEVKLLQHYNISKASMHINELLRNDFSGKSNKLRILKENGRIVKYGIDAAIAMHQNTALEEAFSFAEQNKSILLADALKNNRARNLSVLPDSLLQQEKALQDQKDLLNKEKHEATTAEEKAALSKQENTLNQKIEQFLARIKSDYPKYHALKYQNITATAKDIQTLLDEKSLFLEYFVTDSATYLFALSPTNVELFVINISKAELGLQIQQLRKALSDIRFVFEQKRKAYESYTVSARWFYQRLLEVALKNKTVENLIIVADGELGHLPFETFLTQKASQQTIDYKNLAYLINDYNISYNYSATLWKENLNTESHSQKAAKAGQMLACAAAYQNYGTDSNLVDLRLPNLIQLRSTLQRLPDAENEVTTLSELFRGNFLVGDATNEAFFKKEAPQYSIIHLAMHGILNPNAPMLSSLAFTENKDSLEDNFLQAYEISRLQLNANLVVLSACETGYGKFQQGEGVISLARSFMYAGTPSLVVSLWQVNDNSTAIIMKLFYENIRQGMAKDQALRQAKLNYIQRATNNIAHPAFWSPFIQLGDNRPIYIANKTDSLGKYIGGALLLLALLIGGIYWHRRREMV